MGYGLGDPNVNAIISDLGEAMKDKGGILENVYYVEWTTDISVISHLKEEHVVPVEPGLPPLRVRTIVTSAFDWILEGLGDVTSPLAVNTKVLRTLAARVVELVRVDVPRNNVELDYEQIERLTDNSKDLAKVLGIGNVSSPNLGHPYTLTQVAKLLGHPYWYYANVLLKKACKKLGFDIKSCDNQYHIAIKGNKPNSYTRKYSEELVDLLRKIQAEGITDAPPAATTDPDSRTEV